MRGARARIRDSKNDMNEESVRITDKLKETFLICLHVFYLGGGGGKLFANLYKVHDMMLI